MIKSKVSDMDHNCRIDKKIVKLTNIIQKYLDGIEDISDDREQEMLNMSITYIQETIPSDEIDSSTSVEIKDWLLIKEKINN
jgi:hypothetical protein